MKILTSRGAACCAHNRKYNLPPTTGARRGGRPYMTHVVVFSCALAHLLFATFVFAAPASVETPEDRILSKGFEAYMDGRDKAALHYFEEVVRINPKNDAAHLALKKVKIRLKKAEDVEKAKRVKLAKAKVKEGRELLKTDDVVAAVDAFHAALDADPESKSAKREMKRIKKRMEKVLKRKRFSLSAWAYARGVLAYLDRDWAKAYRIWSDRLTIEPENVALINARTRAEANFVDMMASEREEFLRRGAREFYRQGLYQESKGAWKRILVMREDDQEAMEGLARSEDAILRIQGKNQSRRAHDLLEQALEQYASQKYVLARKSFKQLVQVDPHFKSVYEVYEKRINDKLSEQVYIPKGFGKRDKWRETRPSNEGRTRVKVPESLENMEERRRELESQKKRDPTNIRIQQELDNLKKMQEEESERIYKDGLIAYSQGNRSLAISKWKQVLVLNPDHKKASAALRKAKAEEERTAEERQ